MFRPSCDPDFRQDNPSEANLKSHNGCDVFAPFDGTDFVEFTNDLRAGVQSAGGKVSKKKEWNRMQSPFSDKDFKPTYFGNTFRKGKDSFQNVHRLGVLGKEESVSPLNCLATVVASPAVERCMADADQQCAKIVMLHPGFKGDPFSRLNNDELLIPISSTGAHLDVLFPYCGLWRTSSCYVPFGKCMFFKKGTCYSYSGLPKDQWHQCILVVARGPDFVERELANTFTQRPYSEYPGQDVVRLDETTIEVQDFIDVSATTAMTE
jgi:hypothetical protein